MLLGAPGIATRSILATTNKKLLVVCIVRTFGDGASDGACDNSATAGHDEFTCLMIRPYLLLSS